MQLMPTRNFSSEADLRRVEMLYERLPSGVVAALIGIFLCFVILFGIIEMDALKAWAVLMLSIYAVRIWIWYMFGKADKQDGRIRLWEWLFAAGAFFNGRPWGALFGPLTRRPRIPTHRCSSP